MPNPEAKTTVVNVKDMVDEYPDWGGDDSYVYIGRYSAGMHWGNPWRVGPRYTREDAVNRYDLWVAGVAHSGTEPGRRRWILDNVHRLRGKTLVCHCTPELCHGHVLVRLADDYERSVDESS